MRSGPHCFLLPHARYDRQRHASCRWTSSGLNPAAQPSVAPSSSTIVKRRAPNWIPQEEEQLAISWSHISRQPELIHNQTSEIFYKKVAEHFNHHCSIHYREPNQVRIRSVNSRGARERKRGEREEERERRRERGRREREGEREREKRERPPPFFPL